ncbi:MAG: hypothetical protein M1451_10445, partial [Acidobacteria bacterium]|nr:hypothetical protein [Acidobacteriota bacterium]
SGSRRAWKNQRGGGARNRCWRRRFITEYNTTLANGARTSITTTKNMNYDFLITYLLHPGTALYVGYNSNLQNLDPSLTVLPDGSLARTRHPFTNDGRQFFVKMSYLFRF